MPTPPRRRPANQPARRPRVAGLRRPAGPEPRDVDDREDLSQDRHDEQVPETAPAPDTAVEEPTTPVVSDDGVVGADEPDADEPDADEPEAAAVVEDEPATKPTPSPRPAGKRKNTGSSVAAEPTDDRPRKAKVAAGPRKTSATPGMNAAIVLAVLALVLAGLAFWFKGQADSLTAGADTDNSAVTDSAGTEQVKNQVREAVERTLSYDYTKLDVTAKAVGETLEGRAVCDYEAIYGKLKELAPQQKLVLSTKVRDIGVVSLRGDEAEVLVFVDQSVTRAAVEAGAEPQQTASGAQFAVSAHRSGDAWKITAFDMLSQPLPGGGSQPQC
ncbi:hypothetical protein ACOBQX_14205 [Actinokineospora sp. G85]|uniref:hypothetical protein n=1 Tax=Actinokineospora sp. G85 TaxID=3406626 RepID=UPI003C7910E9